MFAIFFRNPDVGWKEERSRRSIYISPESDVCQAGLAMEEKPGTGFLSLFPSHLIFFECLENWLIPAHVQRTSSV